MGDVGTGKTHTASALCALACERRPGARFFTAPSLVMRLRRARDEGRLDREAALIGRARLLVIDELGFLPLEADGARLLFQVFADAYGRQSVVIATNLEFSRWGPVFGDDQMAAAIIDRIVHHERLVQFRGESYRVRHALMQEGWPLKNFAHDRCAKCSIPDALFAQIVLTKHRNLMKSLKRRRPSTGDVLVDTLLASPSALAATWLDAGSRAAELEARMESVVRDCAPAMLEIEGCGVLSAVELGVAAGDNPGRMRPEASFAMLCGASPLEASSGRTVRHRLNRGGNRRANRALHSIVISRMCTDERTGRYIARRMSESKSKREAMRCLKRYIAREAYRALLAPTTRRHADGALLAARRKRLGILQREVAGELGIRVETVSAIETERAKYFEARDAYEAMLDSLENSKNYD